MKKELAHGDKQIICKLVCRTAEMTRQRERRKKMRSDRQTGKENSPFFPKCCISLESESRPSECAKKRGDKAERRK